MLNLRIRILVFFGAILLLASCHSDIPTSSIETKEEQITTPISFEEIEGKFVGYVYDGDGAPVTGANVSLYSGSSTTDENGLFVFESTGMDGQGTHVEVIKEGYLSSSAMIFPSENSNAISRIQLQSKNNTASSEATASLTISDSPLATIIIPANTLSTQDGSDFDGTYSYFSEVYDLQSSSTYDKIDGGFIGVLKNKKNVVVGAISILDISFFYGGDALELKDESQLDVVFNIGSLSNVSVPEEVILWRMDESTGYWIEEMTVSRSGDEYRTKISSSGQWAIGVGYDISHFCAQFNREEEGSLSGMRFAVKSNGQLCGKGYIDELGYVCSKLPLGTPLLLSIIDPVCDYVLDEFSLSPLGAIENAGILVVDANEELKEGTILCDGEALTSTVLLIKKGASTIVSIPDENGEFKVNVSTEYCDEEEVSLIIIDLNNNLESQTILLDTDISEKLNIDLCGGVDCPLEISYDFQMLDWCEDGEYLSVNAVISGGSGDYEFKWDDGGVGVASSNIQSGIQKCITIFDTALNCESTYCEEVTSFQALRIQSLESYNEECEKNSGKIDVEVSGGKGTYTYLWTSIDGYASTEMNATNLSPSTYTLLVTDEKGCQVQEETIVYDVTVQISSTIDYSCDYTLLTIDDIEGYRPYVYTWNGGGLASENELKVYEPGSYFVTVTDANGCERSGSFSISNIGNGPDLLPTETTTCGADVAYLDGIENAVYTAILENTGESVNLEYDGPMNKIVLPILRVGYSFDVLAVNSDGCEDNVAIRLPRFDGLDDVEVSNTSCSDCEDGKISFSVDLGALCYECGVGEAIVIDAVTNIDVTELNSNSMLKKGKYTVVVLDANSECYIAHSEVEVE